MELLAATVSAVQKELAKGVGSVHVLKTNADMDHNPAQCGEQEIGVIHVTSFDAGI